MDKLIVKGAKEHNLKNVSITIPKNKLVIFTGVSGSGKSSLAMDTIYAEGQRRYVESLSSYARQFLGVMKKPDVESIDGLSPAIAIDQKTISHNPRSTVGTITEIYDYMRLLFARVGHPHCPNCGREISHLSVDQITNLVIERAERSSNEYFRFLILAPVIRDRKGEYSTLLNNLSKQGFARARIDGKIYSLSDEINLIKTNKHSIEVIVDRMTLPRHKNKIEKDTITRLTQSIESALSLSSGYVIISEVLDKSLEFPEIPEEMVDTLYSEKFACANCNISLPEIEPRSFSFNSPQGACPACTGLGTILKIDESTILSDELSIYEGGIIPWATLVEKEGWNRNLLEEVSRTHGISLRDPISKLSKEKLDIILYGSKDRDQRYTISHKGNTYQARFEGVIPNLERRYKETSSDYIRTEIERFMVKEPCETCKGARLNSFALSVTINNKHIANVSNLSIKDCYNFISDLNGILNKKELEIATAILNEIKSRLEFLINVGLTYLTISRSSATLAGGEAQRIRLASQIGSKLSGVLYVLDEPSIGLHSRDHLRLIETLKNLRDLGNTVLVVEHDAQTMLASDYIVDVGPGAGHLGGNIIAVGTPTEIINNKESITGAYLSGRKKISVNNYITEEDLKTYNDKFANRDSAHIEILGCKEHNLKNVTARFPLNKFICVTGVSGSGKSTLVNQTLLAQLRAEMGLKNEIKPGVNAGILGNERIDKVISIDQNPIGRTPRSNPATYTKVFDYIRELYAQTQDAKSRGYKAGRFSFNVKGGRCEACKGDGQVKIEMQFMPDVYVDCEVCNGKRYNREALEIEYKGKNISDVLDLTVTDALDFFSNHPNIHKKLLTLYDVGLGYIKLGQPATTLSGGEAQRIKLASELSRTATGKTLYILDEPTTGLHFADLERLIAIIKRLVLKGNTVIVIEHNLDVIKNADWIIDLGPEGGAGGGEIVFEGTLSELLKAKNSHTAESLRIEGNSTSLN